MSRRWEIKGNGHIEWLKSAFSKKTLNVSYPRREERRPLAKTQMQEEKNNSPVFEDLDANGNSRVSGGMGNIRNNFASAQSIGSRDFKDSCLGFISANRTSVAMSVFGLGLSVGVFSVISTLSFTPIASVSDEILASRSYNLHTRLSKIETAPEQSATPGQIPGQTHLAKNSIGAKGKSNDDSPYQQLAALDAAETGPTSIEDLIGLTADQPPKTEDEAEQTEEAVQSIDPFISKTAVVERGDSLSTVLAKSGISANDIHRVARAISDKFNPKHLRAGQKIDLTFQNISHATDDMVLASLSSPLDMEVFDFSAKVTPEEEDEFTPQLVALEIKTDIDRKVRVERTTIDEFASNEVIAELDESYTRAFGEITSSLYVSAHEKGVPSAVIAELIRMHSYDVDFQREIRAGDTFEVFYKQYSDEEGKAVKSGEVMFGSLTLRGKRYAYYRYVTPDDKIADYYDETGQSAKKFLMRTPVDGARISSRFGLRKHPILGYNKQHSGVDFAARSGTPIMAAGSGTIERAGTNGGYGNYVRIRHTNGYKTAYAHMKSFAKGTKVGAKVKQGQIIGYVGTTGRSTGPHLHYEVHRHDKKINPASVKALTGRKLNGNLLQTFKEERTKLDMRMAEFPVAKPVVTAQVESPRG